MRVCILKIKMWKTVYCWHFTGKGRRGGGVKKTIDVYINVSREIINRDGFLFRVVNGDSEVRILAREKRIAVVIINSTFEILDLGRRGAWLTKCASPSQECKRPWIKRAQRQKHTQYDDVCYLINWRFIYFGKIKNHSLKSYNALLFNASLFLVVIIGRKILQQRFPWLFWEDGKTVSKRRILTEDLCESGKKFLFVRHDYYDQTKPKSLTLFVCP